jgi:membrane-bound lytic murein transglycosylase C
VEEVFRRWDQEVSRVGGEYHRQATIVWEQYRQEIDRIWDEFCRTTAKVWADYSDDTAARTVVDFEQGTIDVEVVVPRVEPNALPKAMDRVKEKFLETFAKEVSPGRSVLEDQLQIQTGQVVTQQNIERFAESEVKGTAQVEKRFQSQDGIERLKVTARIPMAQGHTYHRAKLYTPLAIKYGQERQVAPARALAIMHTESAFNPFASSSEGAIGLMQLIPHAAARDAYQALYGEPKTVSIDYLFNPENNVNLGTVYITLLRDRYLQEVQDPVKRDYLVVCAYNWGIGNIKRLVSQPNRISRDEIVAILRSRTPQETRDYLDKVLSRTTLYESLVAGR